VGPPPGLFDVGGQQLAIPPIRGRAGELKAIGALVTALSQGRGGVLVIEGPPGIGKSRLLTEVMALADQGCTRRRGRCCTPQLPRTPALNSPAPATRTRRSMSSLPPSTPTRSAKRSPMRAGWGTSCDG
jgi:AAA ATPase domain